MVRVLEQQVLEPTGSKEASEVMLSPACLAEDSSAEAWGHAGCCWWEQPAFVCSQTRSDARKPGKDKGEGKVKGKDNDI